MPRKPDIRWQLLLAVVCLGLVLALLSFQVQTAGLCSTRVPAAGGSLVEGIIGAPEHINPLLSDDNLVDQELVTLIFDGLTRYDASGQLVPALAEEWQVEEDGRTVRFTLKEGLTWHDGEPVTAEDVVFSYGLLQDEDFPAPGGVRTLWQSVEISSDGEREVTFTLPAPYSPFLDATTRGIVPAHLLQDVPPGRIADSDFNRAPVGTGPFVTAGENWQRTGRLHLAPDPRHWPQGVKLDNLEFRFYPNVEALLDAFRNGEIQAINSVPPAAIPQVLAQPDSRVYSAPRSRYTQLLFNLNPEEAFEAESAAAVRERDVRQALAYAVDRDSLIDGALDGQGLPLHGPYPSTSWAYSADAFTIYPHEPISATTLLEEAGWVLPEGAAEGTIRQREGEPLSLRLLVLDEPQQRAVAAALAGQWAAVGVATELQVVDATTFATALAERNFDVALTEVEGKGDPDLYDFWSQAAIVSGHNYAGWNSRRASEALEQARQLWDQGERRFYYESFLSYFGNAVPALPLYQQVYTYAVSDAVNELEIGRIDHPRDRYETLANWFLLYRDVAVSCPPAGS